MLMPGLTTGRFIDLHQLTAELVAAGVSVTALGTVGDDVFTYDENGEIVDLPSEAQAVLDAHVPIAPPPSRDEFLRSMLEDLDPEDPDTMIVWLVLLEKLTPEEPLA